MVSGLHQRYADFRDPFLAALLKDVDPSACEAILTAPTPPSTATPQDPGSSHDALVKKSLAKQRATLRLLAELVLMGVLTDTALPLRVLQRVLGQRKDTAFTWLTLATTFCKHYGVVYLGATNPEANARDADANASDPDATSHPAYLTPTQQAPYRAYLTTYHTDTLAPALLDALARLRRLRRANRHHLHNRGAVSAAQEAAVATALAAYTRLEGAADTYVTPVPYGVVSLSLTRAPRVP